MEIDRTRGLIGIALIIVLGVAVYLTFTPEPCADFSCFQQQMTNCEHATFVNEEPEASWGYSIIGKQQEQCAIEVTLLSAKEGDLQLREYEGHSMTCLYDLGVVAYPEKDLDACHGQLKEDIQDVIIEKLYRYIVDNLDEINEELRQL